MKASIRKTGNGVNETYVSHEDFIIRNGYYGFQKVVNKEGEKKFFPCGSAVLVKEILTDLETGEKTLVLEFEDMGGAVVEVQIPRAELEEKEIVKLMHYGLQVDRKSALVLKGCIENQEPNAQMRFEHRNLGFDKFNGEPIFKGYKSLGEVESVYSGDLRIQPTGSLRKWINVVNKEAMGSPMEVILACSLSSVVRDYIRDEYPTENPVISMVGDSSTGKTTGGILAVSTGAVPLFEEKSFMLNFISTDNALVSSLQSSYPVLIDEGSSLTANKRDISALLYTLANGTEKRRMSKELKVLEGKSFCTSIVMTSEQSILRMANGNAGLQVRVWEWTETWTKSAESADKLKRVCVGNYGHAIPALAEYTMEYKKADLVEFCKEWAEDFLAGRDDANRSLVIRAAKLVGVIMMAADMAIEALELEFDLDYLLEFFQNNILVYDEDFDIGLKVYDAIMAYVTKHPNEFGEAIPSAVQEEQARFYFKSGYLKSNKPYILFDGSESEKTLYIQKECMDRIIRSCGIQDSKIVLARLKELGILISDADRYLTTINMGEHTNEAMVLRGYRIRVKTKSQKQMERAVKLERMREETKTRKGKGDDTNE